MNYELSSLSQFIKMHLSSNSEQSTLSPDAIRGLERVLLDEEKRTKVAIRDVIFSGLPDPIIKSFIQNHQTALVVMVMANEVRSSLPLHQLTKLYSLSVRPSVYILHKQVYFTVCRLLDYIEKYFYRYFNLDHPIPDGYIKTTQFRDQEGQGNYFRLF